MKKKIFVTIIIILLLLTIGGVVYKELDNKNTTGGDDPKTPAPSIHEVTSNDEFNINIIKRVNTNATDNYLISPYSIETALSMLREGSSGTTKQEIENVTPKRDIKVLNIDKRISVANAMFIKDRYKNTIKESYVNTLKNEYNSEVLYDKFEKPDVINNWVNEKTYKMIPSILNEIDPTFVLGLANALAIDVEWANQFECNGTNSENFTNTSGKNNKVEMMHNTYSSGTEYIKTENEEGVIIPYSSYNKNGVKVYDDELSTTLQFIAIKPNGNVYEYINNLTSEKLKNIIESKKETKKDEELQLSLPRFEYDSGIDDLKGVLEEMGIKDAFTDKANFKNMSDELDLYVSQAIHKTHISLNEKGTKAAAVTYFGLANFAVQDSKKEIKITFDKPFMYIIRDINSEEMLFFGVVENPNVWKGSTCSEK